MGRDSEGSSSTSASALVMAEVDQVLDHTVTFLSKRDGIDKVLKMAKYLSSLGVELSGEKGGELDKLEAALGLSRKAFRLGKFLGNVKKFRAILEKHCKNKCSSFDGQSGKDDEAHQRVLLFLSLVFNCSEGLYYFLDQLQFLVKAKVVKKSDTVKQVKKIATYAEILSYVTDSLYQVACIRKIQEGRKRLGQQEGEIPPHGLEMKSEKGARASEREEKCVSEIYECRVVLAQNMADFCLALSDLKDDLGFLSGSKFLASMGLLSAAIGMRAKWKK